MIFEKKSWFSVASWCLGVLFTVVLGVVAREQNPAALLLNFVMPEEHSIASAQVHLSRLVGDSSDGPSSDGPSSPTLRLLLIYHDSRSVRSVRVSTQGEHPNLTLFGSLEGDIVQPEIPAKVLQDAGTIAKVDLPAKVLTAWIVRSTDGPVHLSGYHLRSGNIRKRMSATSLPLETYNSLLSSKILFSVVGALLMLVALTVGKRELLY